MIKAAIFDFDGTIGDTVFVCMEALRRSVAPILGRLITDDEIRALFGPTEEGIFQRNFPDDAERGLASYLDWYRELQRDFPNPFPGIVETLRGLKKKGVRVALVTAKGPKSCEISLEFYGLVDFFEIVEVGSPLGRAKAEAIAKVLKDFNLRPEEAVYVGDVSRDVVSARKAGVGAWSAAWAPTAKVDELIAENPDKIFYTVAEMREYLEVLFGKLQD